MNTIEEMIEVMQAFANGQEIEYRHVMYAEWVKTSEPVWNWGKYVYRVYQKPVKKLDIPWGSIQPEYRWAAMDKGGSVYVYANIPPKMKTQSWDNNNTCEHANAFLLIDTDGVDWETSLTERP